MTIVLETVETFSLVSKTGEFHCYLWTWEYMLSPIRGLSNDPFDACRKWREQNVLCMLRIRPAVYPSGTGAIPCVQVILQNWHHVLPRLDMEMTTFNETNDHFRKE